MARATLSPSSSRLEGLRKRSVRRLSFLDLESQVSSVVSRSRYKDISLDEKEMFKMGLQGIHRLLVKVENEVSNFILCNPYRQ